MKRTLLFIILVFISPLTWSECSFKSAQFSYESGSEYLYTIYFNADSTLEFHHERWIPSNADNTELLEYTGTWECIDNIINFAVIGKSYVGVYEQLGLNPIGISPKSKVLKIQSTHGLLGGLALIEFEV